MPAGRYGNWRSRGKEVARGFVTLSSVGGLLACGAMGATGRRANGRVPIEPRDTHVVHEDCPVPQSGVGVEDINGDGRPDRQSASVASSGPCRAMDFDFDGVIDAWVYLDAAGKLRREEHDFDRDGSIDEVSLYRAGVLVEQQRVTSQAGKLDTWHYFSAGKLARTERDANGDDYIDQWWEYPEQRGADCPLIHSDVDGDGQPDPGATVDVCHDRYGDNAPAPEPDPAGSKGVSEVPTEVETPVETDAADGVQTPPSAPEGKP